MSRVLRKTAPAAVALAFLATAGQAATPISNSFQVQIQIMDACSVTTPATLNFGQQAALTANVDQSTTFQVTCSLTTPYNVGLDQGLHGTSVTARKMQGATTDQVSYALYRDATRLQNWGNTVNSDTQAGIGTGLALTHTIYGRVPTQTTPRPDTYTDTITLTLTY